MAGLSKRQRLFVEHYLTHYNATQAIIDAGYKAASRHAAAQKGSILLKDPRVQELVSQRLTEAAMSADEVLMRYAEQARATIADFVDVDADGNIRLKPEAIAERGHLIKSIRMTSAGPVVELHDAQAALTHIGKHHQLFVDRLEIESSSLKAYVSVSPDDWDGDDEAPQ